MRHGQTRTFLRNEFGSKWNAGGWGNNLGRQLRSLRGQPETFGARLGIEAGSCGGGAEPVLSGARGPRPRGGEAPPPPRQGVLGARHLQRAPPAGEVRPHTRGLGKYK